jgi:ATP-binding cassette subfamily B protein
MTAIFVQWLIDRFLPAADTNKIYFTASVILLLLLLRAALNFVRDRLLIALNKRLGIQIVGDFLGRLFRLPKRFFDSRTIGDIISRMRDSQEIQKAVMFVFNTTVIDGMVILGSFILLTYFMPPMIPAIIVVLPVYAVLITRVALKIRFLQNDVMKSRAGLEAAYINSLSGIDTILRFDAAYAFTEFNKNSYYGYQDNLQALRLSQARLVLIADLFAAFLTVCMLGFGTAQVAANLVPLGKMIAGYSLILHILPAINRLVLAGVSVQGAIVAVRRMFDIMMLKPEQSNGKLPFVMKNSFSMIDGRYSWPKRKPLFDGISLEIRRNRITGLTGPSGSGKSSIVQILHRNYQLSAGTLMVDDIPADRVDVAEFRRYVTVVPQWVDVFNGTVAENILLGRTFTGLDVMTERISQLGLQDFVNRFDSGLLTRIGEGGRHLSGGELQMLAFIRALYESPEVLIIDEGLNAVDSEAEMMLWETLQVFAESRAVLLVTHNQRVLEKTDFLYELNGGGIIAVGCPAEMSFDSKHGWR